MRSRGRGCLDRAGGVPGSPLSGVMCRTAVPWAVRGAHTDTEGWRRAKVPYEEHWAPPAWVGSVNMEHEVFVPHPVDTVRRALTDPARIARSIPGLQQDADQNTGSLAGRLRVRVGGHTITYRGTLRVTERDDSFEVEGEGSEVRGDGSVKLALTVTPEAADGGTRLVCVGSVSSQGRLAEFGTETTDPVARRMLDRFGTGLGEGIERTESGPVDAGPAGSAGSAGPADDADDAGPGDPDAGPADARAESPDAGSADAADDAGAAAPGQGRPTPPEPARSGEREAGAEDSPPAGPEDTTAPPRTPSIFDAEIPPSSLDPLGDEGDPLDDGDPVGRDAGRDVRSAADMDRRADVGADDDVDDEDFEVMGSADDLDGVAPGRGVDGVDPLAPLDAGDEPPAEAAHARRTMIGRSTEEVDHAPPRGRYAPVPAAGAAPASATMRWAAPAAAFVLASAVVVGRRVLRRRR